MKQINRTQIESLLLANDKGISNTRGVGGVLSKLWRTILFDLNIGYPQFELMLNNYIIAARTAVEDHKAARLITKGNERRAFERDTMTFKSFFKAMKLLRIKKIRLVVELTHHSNKTTLHEVTTDLNTEEFSHANIDAEKES